MSEGTSERETWAELSRDAKFRFSGRQVISSCVCVCMSSRIRETENVSRSRPFTPRPFLKMFFDNLAVFVVPLVCTSLFSLLSVHGFPRVPSSSPLRRVLTTVDPPSDDLSSSEENDDIAGPIRDFFSFDKRSLSTATNPFPLISAMADPEQQKSLQELVDSPPISQSLKESVEGNPLMRVWLGLLLQKLMEEQPQPYIFKYGRRRKWNSSAISLHDWTRATTGDSSIIIIIGRRSWIKVPFRSLHFSLSLFLIRADFQRTLPCQGQRTNFLDSEWIVRGRTNTNDSCDRESIRWHDERGRRFRSSR